MLRRRTMTKAFLVGIQKLEERIGPKETDALMREIGRELAESEGPGIMGEQVGDLNCFRICLFAPKLDEFLEEFGSPQGHEELLQYVTRDDVDSEGPAAVNVCCAMCYAFRKRRGELSGKKDLLHLGAKYKTGGTRNIGEESVAKTAHTEDEIDQLLETYDCINKYTE